MSAESDISTTVMSIEIATEKLRKLDAFATERRIHYLAQSATRTMRFGVEKFWNKHYNLRSGKTKQLALFSGGTRLGDWQVNKDKSGSRKYVIEPSPNNRTFRSRNGNKRLVAFKWQKPESVGDFRASVVHVSSFPMNLYERDVLLKGFVRDLHIIRKGTHIMKSELPPKAQSELNATAQPFMVDLERRWEEMQREGKV